MTTNMATSRVIDNDFENGFEGNEMFVSNVNRLKMIATNILKWLEHPAVSRTDPSDRTRLRKMILSQGPHQWIIPVKEKPEDKNGSHDCIVVVTFQSPEIMSTMSAGLEILNAVKKDYPDNVCVRHVWIMDKNGTGLNLLRNYRDQVKHPNSALYVKYGHHYIWAKPALKKEYGSALDMRLASAAVKEALG